MAKVRFIIQVTVECTDCSDETIRASEYAAARFQEQLEANMDSNCTQLRKDNPFVKFTVRNADDDEGESWRGS